MKKTLLSLAAFSAFGFESVAHAEKVDICVFDLLGNPVSLSRWRKNGHWLQKAGAQTSI